MAGSYGYYAKPGGSGYGFYDPNGNAISAQTYATGTGTDFSTLINQLANAGDTGAQSLIKQQGANLGKQETQSGIGKAFYWSGTGAADPVAQSILSQQASGGGTAATPAQGTDYTQEAQYWADQQAGIDQQEARLPTQQQVGQGNIDNSYNSAFATLTGQQTTANQALATSKQNTTQDNITAKNNIDTSVGQNATAIQRLLGSRGAGDSTASTVLAPYSAAVIGNGERQQVQTAYGRNIAAENTAQTASDTGYQGAFGDLLSQKTNKESALKSGIASATAALEQQRATDAASAVQAQGGNYAAARAAEAPYLQKANDLLGQVDQLGTQVSFTPQAVAAQAPATQAYSYDPATISAQTGATPSQAAATGPYAILVGQKKDANGNPIS